MKRVLIIPFFICAKLLFMKTQVAFSLAILLLLSAGCKTQKTCAAVNADVPTIIYKTKANYSKYVPVTLSADKQKIVSYPDPKDVFYNGKLATPTTLVNDYWLDNRGITSNSAFVKITYEEYSKLEQAPNLEILFNAIIDKDPFTEIYNAGSRSKYKDEVKDLNALIKKGGLKKLGRVK